MNYKHFYKIILYNITLVTGYLVENVCLLFYLEACLSNHCLYLLLSTFNSILSFCHWYHHSLCFFPSLTFPLNPLKYLVQEYKSQNRSGLLLIFVSIPILVDGLSYVISGIDSIDSVFKMSNWYSLVRHEINLVDYMISIPFLS